MSNILKEFIQNNKLEFKDGNRNSPAVILCGFALNQGLKVKDCLDALDEESKDDSKTVEEIKRVYKYAEYSGYGNYWDTDEAKENYKF